MRSEDPFKASDVDVVIADDEDICRAAAAQALKRFGFLPNRVHEAENGEEALQKVTELQEGDEKIMYKGQRRSLPVIVFLDIKMPGSDGQGCARQISSLYQQNVSREPFLVCATARRVSQGSSDQNFFHCAVPKTFATSKLRYCFDTCQDWWLKGGGEPGKVALDPAPRSNEWGGRTAGMAQTMSDLPSMGPALGSSSRSKRSPISPPPMVGAPLIERAPAYGSRFSASDFSSSPGSAMPPPTKSSTGLGGTAPKATSTLLGSPSGGHSLGGTAPTATSSFLGSSSGGVGSMGKSSSMGGGSAGKTLSAGSPSALPPRGAGNSIESLDNLAPPRPPFEDVEMICLVGRGSFGRVYRARWDISTVALKVVEHFDEAKPSIMAFEGKLSSSLAHPNLVQTFKYSIRDLCNTDSEGGQERGSMLRGFELWIVQEWCGLGTLAAKISKKEIIDGGGYAEVIEVCAEIASAANYLHGRGIIHGDLTASNILLMERRCQKGYVAKVSDFGLARVLDSGASGINTATMGTVTYMPPELFQLEGCALTKKVDVYAFGVVMWQLCTSSTPFEGLQPTQVVVMVAQGATLELPINVPKPLAKVFSTCIARKPSDRPPFERIIQELLQMASLERG